MLPEEEDKVQEPEEGISAYELWQLHKKKQEIRTKYLALWNATINQTGTGRPIDALIAPAAACVAPPHGMNRYAAVFLNVALDSLPFYDLGYIHIQIRGMPWITLDLSFPLAWEILFKIPKSTVVISSVTRTRIAGTGVRL
jgi:hypothetical protein